MGLSNYQLVLLDNLIYLDTIIDAKNRNYTVAEIINKLLYAEGSDEPGSGTIQTDCFNPHNGDANCMMTKEEWVKVLLAIKADEVLCNMQIHNVQDMGKNGFRAATFISEEAGENVIIFKGTTTANEWIDNGEGGYSIQTENQYLAVDYVNNLDVVNNNSFIVSGHSKGGNLAQYAALFATDTLIDRCVSFDGQGFSKELCETEEYKKAIEKRGDNLYLVASSGDYVNVLFNAAVPDDHKMYLGANAVGTNLLGYHRPDNIFKKDADGNIMGLNGSGTISVVSYFLKDFISYITETEADVNKKKLVYDGLMSVLAATGDDSDDMELATGALGKQLLIDIGVTVLVRGLLARFGMDPSDVRGLTTVLTLGDKAFDIDSIGKCLTENEYKGELYELVESGAVGLLYGYMEDYIKQGKESLFTLIGMVNDFVRNNHVEASQKLMTIIQNRMWEDMLSVFETEWEYSLENLNAEIEKTNIGTNSKGEGTKGSIYYIRNDMGGLNYLGNGGANSIVGSAEDDYMHGGNGRDTVVGGDGDDVIFGGRGNDNLYGEGGNDVYAINRYDGLDVIYNSNTNEELNFICFGSGIDRDQVEYSEESGDLYIRYNKDYPDDCIVIVKDFFNVDSEGNLPNAIDAILYEDGEVVTIVEIFHEIGYEGETGKNMFEKIKDMTEEEREKIFEKYDFLEFEYHMRYENKETESDKTTSGSISGTIDKTDSVEVEKKEEYVASAIAAIATANVRNMVKDAEEELLGKRIDKYHEAQINSYIDPIVIDLNGDGNFTTTLDEGVHFDFNGDGFAEKTAWASNGDGFIVRDVNANGMIDDGTELFGDQTILENGNMASTGFQALSDLDENEDGILDAQDSKYAELEIWMDSDRNGKSQKEEIFSLQEVGIISIDLAHKIVNKLDTNGNIINAEGKIGGIYNNFSINEYGFSIDYVNTEYRGEIIDTSNIDENLPKLKGCGTLLDLSKAMAVKEELRELVTSYVNEKDYHKKMEMVQDILFCWAGAEDVALKSRGGYIDARKLSVLENVYGEKFVGMKGPNPIVGAANILNELYDELLADVQQNLLIQTVYKESLLALSIKLDENLEYSCNYEQAIQNIADKYSVYYIPVFTKYLLENTAVGEFWDRQQLYEQVKEENHLLAEYIIHDSIVVGTEEGGKLKGTLENDIFVGTSADEIMCGGVGEDIYVFLLGSGQDSIIDVGENGIDRILFGEGIEPDDIEVTRDAACLYMTNHKSGDRVQICQCFTNGRFIESVEFAGGTVWNIEDLKQRVRYYHGTEENDSIKAYNNEYGHSYEDDYLYGGAGEDELYGEKGDDVLVGGTGDDVLEGGLGADTYIFNLGDGNDLIDLENNINARKQDKIVFGEGISQEDIKVIRKGDCLLLQNEKSEDSVMINGFYNGEGYVLEQIEFADGVNWTLEDIKKRASIVTGTDEGEYLGLGSEAYGYDINGTIYGKAGDDYIDGSKGDNSLFGGDGNDHLYGFSGNDELYGEKGDDELYGQDGADTYIFNLGDGNDIIFDNDTTEEGKFDKIVFGEGINPEDVKVTRKGSSLLLQNEKSGDSVIVNKFYSGESYVIEQIEFADGTSWTLEDIKEKTSILVGTDGADTLTLYNAAYGYNADGVIYGGAGNDYLYGGNGNNTLYGGEGRDCLYGGVGDDILYGGAGDDSLRAGEGNDRLYGEEGNDNFIGGVGDNFLCGGSGDDLMSDDGGNDTYYFETGFGKDKIVDIGVVTDEDVVLFGENISKSDIVFSRSGMNLMVSVLGTNDSITCISHYKSDKTSRIEQFTTSDGYMIDYQKVDLMIQAIASFEDTSGMMWEEAIKNNNETANDIVNQWWVKETV